MKKEKRNYWFKLSLNFVFEPNSRFDFLMKQKNGSDYVVLYEMLCLLTINTCGVLVKDYGEIVVKYDVEQIQQDCKYFKYDTIVVAIELYKKIGLVAEDPDGFLEINDFDELVGSESESAARVRKHRLKKAALGALQCNKNVTQEKRYKIEDTIIDSTDIKLSIDSSCSNNYMDNNEQESLQTCYIDVTKTGAIGGDFVYPERPNIDAEQNEIRLKRLGKYEHLLISDEQFGSLCDLLSLEEIDTYCQKMEDMLAKGYKFSCSHYEQILKMVNKDRRVRKNE